MVSVKVRNINFGEKSVDLKGNTVSELIQSMGTNDDAVLFVEESGKICTKDTKLKEGSTVNMIEVFSGG